MSTYPPPPSPPPPPPPTEELPLATGPDADDIQGNVLAGFLKDHQYFIFVRADATQPRQWLSELLPRIATTRQVSTFNAQFSADKDVRGGDDPPNLKAVWVNVGFTFSGIAALAPTRVPDLQQFPAFAAGAAERADALGDTGEEAPNKWVLGNPDHPIHAILTIAADEKDDLRLELDRVREILFRNGVRIVFEQRGDTLSGNRRGHEHFGFKDGISQPGIRGFHAEKDRERAGHFGTEMIEAGEFVLGHPREPESDALPQVNWLRNGSFQVFRRLAQDVPGFWAQVTEQAAKLPESNPLRVKADALAAKLVGRWRSGTPLARAPERDNRSSQNRRHDNDFDYVANPVPDSDGHRTPQFAHIRKMYPRKLGFGDRTRRILRRGIPFGPVFDPAAGRGHGLDGERGLLFNVFMASIEQQFEFLQQSWANNKNFPPGANAGPDPVIGKAADPPTVRLQRENQPDQFLDFRRFVRTTGGVYAFAPSLTTLKLLASGGL